jgi:acyl-CoA synthetase (AMP-forming)/AMP-acid ligase II
LQYSEKTEPIVVGFWELDMLDSIKKAAKQFKNKTAIKDGETELSFEEVYINANRLANALLAKGLKKGDRVNLLFHNCYQILEIYLGLANTGFVRVPLNTRESAQNHTFQINNCDANTLIFDQKFLEVVTAIKPQIQGVTTFICRTDNPARLPDWASDYDALLSRAPHTEPRVEIHQDDMIRMGHSGGTTGMPKATVQTYKTELAFLTHLLSDVVTLNSRDVFLHIHPMSHGSGTFIFPCWVRGIRQVIAKSTQPEHLLKTIGEEKITSSFMVPTVLIRLVDFPEIKKYDCSTLRRVFYGAAPSPPTKIMKAVEIFGPILCQVYGQSEVPTGATILFPEDHILEGSEEKMLKRFSSIGRESRSCRVKIVDKNDKEMPVEQIGEIIVKSDFAMRGYYNRPEETAETIKGGWIHTRDMGYRDKDGYIYLVGRASEMIISGGYNVYPVEIENVLYTHLAVKEACVFGIPHVEWGEEIKALVYPKEGTTVTEDDLIEFCSMKLARFKCPKSIEFLDTEPPKTAVGKINKKALIAEYRQI